jgi:hypothetical protein
MEELLTDAEQRLLRLHLAFMGSMELGAQYGVERSVVK